MTAKERFAPGQQIWYRVPGMRWRGEFMRMSKTGKKALIRYECHGFPNRSYVDPKNIEPRYEQCIHGLPITDDCDRCDQMEKEHG